MNYLFEMVSNQHKEYPKGDDPEVVARMLPLYKYLELARRIIGKFAPANIKSHMLSSEDAISFVAFKIMRGDWDYDESKGKITTYRGVCGKFAITDYIEHLNKQRTMISIDQERSGDSSISDILSYEPHVDLYSDDPKLAGKQRYISTLLHTLTPMERECIELRYWWGLDSKETAEVLGVKRQAVQYALSRAVESMKRTAGVET